MVETKSFHRNLGKIPKVRDVKKLLNYLKTLKKAPEKMVIAV
jgi:hypothetical protein